MPEEITSGSESEEPKPQIVHDDIMTRLLAFQRQLREGAEPAAKTEPDELVDLTSAEAEVEAAAEPAP